MDKILWVAVTLGVIAIIALGAVGFVKANIAENPETVTEKQSSSCSYPQSNCPAGGGCTAENNCGVSTCGALKGRSCGCS